jgi:hypothetical protein
MPRSKDGPLPRSRASWPRVLLFIVVAAGTAALFRQGLLAPYFNPFGSIDLGRPQAWLIDWRLAALKYDSAQCRRSLVAPHIEAQTIADRPLRDGCGWINAVRVSTAGGVQAGFDPLTCEAAAALALWLEHEVQPLARELLGQRVTSIRNFGSYSCRNIVGNPMWKALRSQHATANALDIAGFTLANGRSITVLGSWSGDGPEARFLKAVHARACRYFRVAIGPDYNAAHRDHFHFDRGPFTRCK